MLQYPSMDISVIKALAAELAGTLLDRRLTALDEGASGEFYLTFSRLLNPSTSRRGTEGEGSEGVRATGQGVRAGVRVLLSPRPPIPRIYLTAALPRKSGEKTPFAQALWNHIAGATLESVVQPGLERIIIFNLERKAKRFRLIFELAGKKPNLVLLDDAGKILLAQSYVPAGEALRPVLPGIAYEPPPLPAKGGLLSPLMAREAEALGISTDALIARLGGPYAPCVYETPKGLVLAAFPLKQHEGSPRREFAGMSDAVEYFYEEAACRKRAAEAKADAVRELKKKLASANKKVAAIEADIARADGAETDILHGQALLASLRMVPEGADSALLPNPYIDGEKLAIPLDVKLSPARNADAYFKKAKKARAGLEVLAKRLKDAKGEADALEARLRQVEAGEWFAEPAPEAGRSVTKPGGPGKAAGAGPKFPSFTSSDGYEVLYAKNAKMNDLLTFKLAQPMDLWLHAQGYRGGHVIVRNPKRRPDIPLQTIIEAAEAAAYFSGAKKDSTAAVDYTFRKFVRKPKDPSPGQAVFTNNKTVFVAPRKR